MGMLPPILVELKANASELHSKIGDASKEIEKLGTDGATHGAKFKAGIKAGMEGAGAAMTGLGAVLATEGIKGTEATTLLTTAVTNAGGSMEELDPKIHQVVGSMANFGHSSSDTETALARLTDATGNPTKALDQMGLVADVAARKHISLTDAANMVGKIDIGKGTKALTEFGLTAEKSADSVKLLSTATKDHESAVAAQSTAQEKLRDLMERLGGRTNLSVSETQALRHAHEDVDAATKKVTDSTTALATAQTAANTSTDNVAKNLDNLHNKVMGGAAAQADTFGGKLNSLKAHLENVAEAAGKKVGPALAIAGPALAGLGGAADTAGKVLGHFKTAQEGATVATEGLTAATEEGEVAEGIALGPILLIVGALALVGVAAYELATHWSEVWDGVKMVIGKVWDFIKDTFDKITGIISGVIDWVKDHWPLILAILTGPFGLAVLAISSHWDEIVGFVRDIPGRIAGICATMWDGIKNAFSAAVGWISDRIGDVVGFFAGLPGRLASGAGDLFKFVRDKIVDARDWLHDRIWDVIHFFESVPGLLATAGSKMWDWIGDSFKGIINTVIGWWNDLHFTTPHFSIGPIDTPSITIGMPHIPLLAAGGYVTGEGLAWLHAAEVVTPAGGAGGGGGGDVYMTFTVPPNADMAAIGAVTVSAIREYEARNGKTWRS